MTGISCNGRTKLSCYDLAADRSAMSWRGCRYVEREKKPEKGPGGDFVAGLKAKEKGFEIDTFASYIDGPLAVRLVYTFWGCLRFMLCSRRYDLFHLHTAERGSTFRKYFYLWWAKGQAGR